jgi:hypothetical protein
VTGSEFVRWVGLFGPGPWVGLIVLLLVVIWSGRR